MGPPVSQASLVPPGATMGPPVESSSMVGWSVSPYITKSGNPVLSKSVTVSKGKAAGRTRIIYAVEYPDGKKRRISMQEITSGKKPRRSMKRAAPKAKICKDKKASSSSKSSSYKAEKAKAMRKFKRRSALKQKIDRSITADHIVRKSKNYKPGQNDFAGVDTKRR